jgi:hypothetical protein
MSTPVSPRQPAALKHAIRREDGTLALFLRLVRSRSGIAPKDGRRWASRNDLICDELSPKTEQRLGLDVIYDSDALIRLDKKASIS